MTAPLKQTTGPSTLSPYNSIYNIFIFHCFFSLFSNTPNFSLFEPLNCHAKSKCLVTAFVCVLSYRGDAKKKKKSHLHYSSWGCIPILTMEHPFVHYFYLQMFRWDALAQSNIFVASELLGQFHLTPGSVTTRSFFLFIFVESYIQVFKHLIVEYKNTNELYKKFCQTRLYPKI